MAGTFPNAVRAISGTIIVAAPVTVKPGPIDRVIVTPGGVTLLPNQTQTFNAQAVDSDNNVIPNRTFNWSLVGMPAGAQLNNVTATSAQLTGLTVAGTYLNSVKAADSAQPAKFGTANVQVNPAAINSVTVVPANVTLAPGERRTFTAEARDSSGNVIPGVVAGWQTGSAGIIESSGAATITLRASNTAGVYANQIVATVGSKNGTASVTVNAGNTNRINVTPNPGVMAINGSAGFVASAVDNQGNPKPGVNYSWTAASPFTLVGATNGANVTVQSSQAAGVYPNALSVSGDGKTTSITITVQPAQLTSLRITPASGTVTADQDIQFSAEGLDQFGNIITAPAVTWSAAPGAGIIDQSGKLKASRTAGTYANAISASVNGISGQATVTVQAGALERIGVTPSPASVAAGTKRLFTASGFDSFNNVVALAQTTWTANAGGVIVSSGVNTATFQAGAAPGSFVGAVRVASGNKEALVDIIVSQLVLSVTTSSSLLRTNGQDVITVTAVGKDLFESPIDAGNLLTVSIASCLAGTCELLRTPTENPGQLSVTALTGQNGAVTFYLRSRNTLGPGGVLTPTRSSIVVQAAFGQLRASTTVQGRFDPLRLQLGGIGRDTPTAANNHTVCQATPLGVPSRTVQLLNNSNNIYRFKAPTRSAKITVSGYGSTGYIRLFRIRYDRCPTNQSEIYQVGLAPLSGGSSSATFAELAPQSDYLLAIYTTGALSPSAYVLDIQAQ